MELLDSFHIVPFLKDYDFFTEDDLNTQLPDLDKEDEEEDTNNITNRDTFDFEDFHYDFDDADYGGDMDPFDLQNDDENYSGNDDASNEPVYKEEEVEMNLNENDFLSALRNNGDNDMFNYFDSTLAKNWAGPEHWKLRRPVIINTDPGKKN
jgi:condensin complex subunit 2